MTMNRPAAVSMDPVVCRNPVQYGDVSKEPRNASIRPARAMMAPFLAHEGRKLLAPL